ncbi:clathrin light chain [Radiomyces spectabilis]|uniref:clathrin light chain n=1 Tax=Radiomyces spectabilis TaxID=64574 RepID=UPI00221EC1E6|nr:clathrin light chain [Radiomyces spectabilis]KAI8381055.1 clathrin light chain [Radiomyces spectabilis]
MSDFGDFNSPNEDPTADFLARERAALGADADLFATDDVSSPSQFTGAISPAPVLPSPSAMVSPSTGGLGAQDYNDMPTSHTAVSPNGAGDYSAFEHEFPKAEDLESSQAFHKAMLPDEEPEVVRQWREKQKEVIAQRDEEEERKKQETIEQAREDIDRFYEEYNEKKQKAIEENREREENYQKDREEASSANVWERVVREFDLSSSAKAARQTRDVSRMRELMTDLRKDPKAPGTIVQA